MALGSLIVAALALVVAIIGIALQSVDFFDRRRERERPIDLETFEEQIPQPSPTNWTIRVRSKRRFEHFRIMFDGVPLKVFTNPFESCEEVLLDKGGAENFRIPSNHPVSTNSRVVALDGSKIVEDRKWGTIPQTRP